MVGRQQGQTLSVKIHFIHIELNTVTCNTYNILSSLHIKQIIYFFVQQCTPHDIGHISIRLHVILLHQLLTYGDADEVMQVWLKEQQMWPAWKQSKYNAINAIRTQSKTKLAKQYQKLEMVCMSETVVQPLIFEDYCTVEAFGGP